MTAIDWKVILLVFGFLLALITTGICFIAWRTCKVIEGIKQTAVYQNQRLEVLIKELRKENK